MMKKATAFLCVILVVAGFAALATGRLTGRRSPGFGASGSEA